MKRLFSMTLDVTDYLLSNDIEPVADVVSNLSDMAKTASVHSIDERDMLDNENVAVIFYHPQLGELRKYACDSAGTTEININLLSRTLDELPNEIIKVAANNLGYVASNLNIDIPANLESYQTGKWVDPIVDITHLSKVAFYQKLQDLEEAVEKVAYALPADKRFAIHDAEHVKLAIDYFNSKKNDLDLHERITFAKELGKQAEQHDVKLPKNIDDYYYLDTSSYNTDFEEHVHGRLNMVHNEKIAEVYNAILEKHAEYEPVEIAKLMNEADNYSGLHKAVEKGLLKNAALATFGIEKNSFFSRNIEKLRGKDVDYMDKEAYMSLFTEDGEDIFNSLPKPTKDRLTKEME